MKAKRIVVMGFMGSMPIAGVIWQHIHYVVGLQRLGHDVYYIEDSARLPYNPETFEVTNEFDYAARLLSRLSREFGFKSRWAFCARYLPGNPTAGLPFKKIQQLYREADAILNVCGTQEFNDDLLVSDRILYIESDPGVEQIKIDKEVKSTIEYLRRHRALFTFGENVGTKKFPVPLHGLRWLPTRQPIVTDLSAQTTSYQWTLPSSPAGIPNLRVRVIASDRLFQTSATAAGNAITVTPGTHPGDVNGDGHVNIDDLLLVINAWGACPPAPAACPADVNHDAAVNIDDLLMVITHWS